MSDNVVAFPPSKPPAGAATPVSSAGSSPHRRASGSSSVDDLNRHICTEQDLRSLLSSLVERSCRASGAHQCWVGLLNTETGAILPVSSYDLDHGHDAGLHCLAVPEDVCAALGFKPRGKRGPKTVGPSEQTRSVQWRGEVGEGKAQPHMAVRLEFLGRPVGVLVNRFSAGTSLRPFDLQLLETIADQVSILTGISRLLDEAGKKTRETETIDSVAEKLSGPQGLAQKLNQALEMVIHFLDVDGGVIHLVDSATGELHLTSAHRGVPASALSDADNLAPGEGISGWVVKHGKPLMLQDIQEDKRLTRSWVRHEEVHCWASAPLVSNGEAVGTIGVFNHDSKPMAPETEHFLSAIGRQIGIAVQNANLLEDTVALEKERIRLLRDRLREITSHHEEERARLARDLHDEVAQGLVSAIVGLRMLAKHQGANAGLRQELQGMSDDLAETLNQSRGIITGLRSALGEKKTFVEAVRDDLLARVGSQTGAMCGFETRDWPENLEPEAALNLYRIVQEALTNIRKHSRPSNLLLKLDGTDEQHLAIVVQDDGCGFDLSRMEDALAGDHHGIVGMDERAELLQGELEVASTPGLGTTVKVTVPKSACLAREEGDEQGTES